MTDLLDIILGVDVSPIKTAKQELAELGNSFNAASKSASIFEQAFARAAAQSARDANFLRDMVRANQELINTNLGVSNSYKSAKDSASAFGVVLNNIDKASKAFTANFNSVVGVTGGRATSSGAGFGALADEIDRLGQKYNSIYASSKLYENTLNELNRAVMLGVISDKQREASLESLNAQMATGTGIFKNYTQQLGNNASRMGTIFQQTGYQVSDFIVQVQSGTNPLVAFSQQATQLVGSLYALPPAFLATEVSIIGLEVTVSTLIAGFTIIVPLLAAVAMAFMRSGDSAKSASEKTDIYSEAIKNLTSEIQKNQDAFLKAKFDTDILGVASASQQIEDFQSRIVSLQASIDRMKSQGGKAAAFAGLVTGSVEELEAQKKALQDLLDKLQAQAEAQRMLNGGLSVAGGLQRAAVRDKQEELRVAKEHIQVLIRAYECYGKSRVEGEKLAKIDFEAGVKAAATAAKTLADNLGVSLSAAQGIMALGKDKAEHGAEIYDPRSPNYIKGAGTFAEISSGAHPISTYGQPVKDKTSPTGTGGGPSTDTIENKLQELYKYLDAQKQVEAYMLADEEIAYQQREDLLKTALDKKLITIQDYQQMERDLTLKHQEEIANIEKMRQTTQIKDAGTFFGGMADLAKAGGDKTAKAVRVFSAAQALTNSYLAFTQILADPSLIGRPWARFGMAASALASGLSAVAAIKSGGGGSISSGGSSGGKNPASVETSASTQTASPQVVMIQGLKPTDVFTGEQLSTLFDSLYKENRNRGMVFQVAR